RGQHEARLPGGGRTLIGANDPGRLRGAAQRVAEVELDVKGEADLDEEYFHLGLGPHRDLQQKHSRLVAFEDGADLGVRLQRHRDLDDLEVDIAIDLAVQGRD